MSVHVFTVATLFAVCATIVLAWVTRPVDAFAVHFARTLNTPFAVGAILLATAAALSFGPYPGTVLVLVGYLFVRLLKSLFDWRRGGLSGAGILFSLAVFMTTGLTILSALRRVW